MVASFDCASIRESALASDVSTLSCRQRPWDMRASAVPVDDACADRVRAAVDAGVCAKRIARPFADPREALRNLGLTCGGVLSNAGALLFARTRVPLIECRAYDSSRCDVLVDACDCFGPLDAACGQACAFALDNAFLAFEAGDSAHSSYAALLAGIFREALANALVHRDYLVFAPIRCIVFPGCMEISNPGAFPPAAFPAAKPDGSASAKRSIEELLGRAAWPRNSLLAEALYRFGFIDARGTGLARIVAACALCVLVPQWENRNGCAVLKISDPRR